MLNTDRKFNFVKRRISLLAWQLTDVQPNEGSALMNIEYILTNISRIDDLGKKKMKRHTSRCFFLVKQIWGSGTSTWWMSVLFLLSLFLKLLAAAMGHGRVRMVLK